MTNTQTQKPTVVTGFAPSPTGFLHIGGARTALFNWAFARHYGGKFLLRIEDTDRARSTEEAIEAILDGLAWLEIEADEPPLYQHKQAARHVEVANQLLAAGHAYKCTCTQEELDAMRDKARAENRPPRYDGTCRNRPPDDIAQGAAFAVRFKAPQTGKTIIDDKVQGQVAVANEQIDDFILLRSNGQPTYMLCVVVDDYDMGITHIIRGDDHLTNAVKQHQIYQALDWSVPVFAHIPLIHGADGAKLSKRHGAVSVLDYRNRYLPEAMRNYLARLGWSHGDDEIFSTEQFVKWFGLEAIGKSPARFDMDKLNHLNTHYIRHADDTRLVDILIQGDPQAAAYKEKLLKAMPALKEKAQDLHMLATHAAFIFANRPLAINEKNGDEKGAKHVTADTCALLAQLYPLLEQLEDWRKDEIKNLIDAFLAQTEMKLGAFAPALRAVLTGSANPLGIYDILAILGKEEVLARLDRYIKAHKGAK